MTRPALSVDRGAGRRVADAAADRLALDLLDAYGAISTLWRQRGLYRAARLVGRALWVGKEAEIRLAPDAAVRFPADDPYWSRMLLRSYDHEPELARLLRRLAPIDYGFVDCGANIGYWSVFAASSCGGRKEVLAVEASAATFARLIANAAPHAGRIRPFHRAVLDRSGVTVRLGGDDHQARAVSGSGEGEAVASISIDDLIAEAGWRDRAVVVKLDVEGVEKEAIAGMRQALGRDALVVYEDHGGDPSHALTRHLLGERGLRVAFLGDHATTPIEAPEQLTALKPDRTRGYNLLAFANESRWASLAST